MKELTLAEKAQKVIRWRLDVEEPEMVESPNYKRTHLFIGPSISLKELNSCCDAANAFFEKLELPYRVGWLGGEFLPATTADRFARPIYYGDFKE